jgi:hypothetical protein
MGFMDKAKKMAEQAQAKLDEVQKGVNSSQGGQPQGGGPVVEYDQHGRPIQPAAVTPDAGAPPAPPAPAAETPGVPPTAPVSAGPPGSAAPTPDPAAPPAPKPPAPPAAAAAPGGPPAPEDRNRPSTEPPKLSSGDPLAG